MRLLLSLVPAGLVALAACGAEVSTGTGGQTSSATGNTGASSTTSSNSTTGTGMGGGAHGDCQTDADCGGKPCVALTPGGYLVCLAPIAEVTMCDPSTPPNDCCSSADCVAAGMGSCYAASKLNFCGGAFPIDNKCVADACQSDADCGAGTLCAPAGAFGYPKRFCLTAHCHTDADCAAKPGGACLPIGGNPCCSLNLPAGLGCAYPGGCSKDSDCPGGTCTLDMNKGVGVCGPNGPGCPP